MSINEIISSVFLPEKFTINECDEDHDEGYKCVEIKTIDNNYCAQLQIYSDHIHINGLEKCGDITGSNILEMIERMAERMGNINYITIGDGSNLFLCPGIRGIPLATLKILTTGKSFYNSKGYISKRFYNSEGKLSKPDYEKYQDGIKDTLKMDYETFMKKVYDLKRRHRVGRMTLKKYDETYLDEIEKEQVTGIRLFPCVKETVQKYFNYVWKDIQDSIKTKGCDDEETKEKCQWLSDYLGFHIHHYILNYNGELRKNIKLAGGRKKCRTRKSRVNNRKSKKRN